LRTVRKSQRGREKGEEKLDPNNRSNNKKIRRSFKKIRLPNKQKSKQRNGSARHLLTITAESIQSV